MESKIFVVIIVVCVALILFGVIKHRFDLIVNFGLRFFVGILGIYLINALLMNLNLSLGVGTNGLNALLIGLFGVPGFFLVYGLAAYFYFLK